MFPRYYMHSIAHNSVLPVAKELTHYFSIPAILSVLIFTFLTRFFCIVFFVVSYDTYVYVICHTVSLRRTSRNGMILLVQYSVDAW